jgi:hypothetical protein
MAIAPLLMEAISKPGTDPLANAIVKELGAQAPILTDRWNALPTRLKQARFGVGKPQPWLQSATQLDLAGKVTAFATAYAEAHQKLISERKSLIVKEFEASLRNTSNPHIPPSWFNQDPAMAVEYSRYRAAKFGENGCRCEKPVETTPPPQNPTKFGVVTQKLKCFDQCEKGYDEVYFVCVAVDGNGQCTETVSPILRINDDDDDVLYPRHWIYPMKPANGFLDVAIQMMEDDGGYQRIGSALTAFGGVVRAIGGAIPNPFVAGAGLAIVVIGNLIAVLGNLDSDDNYGIQTKTWNSAATLAAAPGVYLMHYSGRDWSKDSFDFDLTINVSCT